MATRFLERQDCVYTGTTALMYAAGTAVYITEELYKPLAERNIPMMNLHDYKERCEYCGSKNKNDNPVCEKCGAPL